MDVTSKKNDALFRTLNRLLDRRARGTALDVVDREHGFERQTLRKIVVEGRVDLLQIGEREILQLTTALDAQLDGLANSLVSEA
jgi:hypothetical protein